MSEAGEIASFRADIPEAALTDLRDRLRRVRWPERETVDDWSQGVPLGYLRQLCEYWLTGTGASAARLYWESSRQVNEWISGLATDTVDVPVGCTVFPHELQRPSRRWAAKRFSDIRYWNEPAAGGHFPALEQPAEFVTELRAFFRLVR